MSGCSDTDTCPFCGDEHMHCYSEQKPYDAVSGECLECGFEYHTEGSQMTLEEVNERRKEQELEPLEKLAESSVQLIGGHLPSEWWPPLKG